MGYAAGMLMISKALSSRLLVPTLLLLVWASTPVAEAGPSIVFLLGEKEYKTLDSVPAFYQETLKPEGFEANLIAASHEDEVRNDFDGLAEALQLADLCFISVRRRAPAEEDMEALKAFVAAGKPIVAIRTSSHAFHLRGKDAPEGHGLWEAFDPVILGGNYNGHYGKETVQVTVAEGSEDHPILKDVGKLPPSDKLYRAAPLKEGTTLLLEGKIDGKPAEPVAWTHRAGPNQAKIFYTSLGQTSDFEDPQFRKLLANAIAWALEKEE